MSQEHVSTTAIRVRHNGLNVGVYPLDNSMLVDLVESKFTSLERFIQLVEQYGIVSTVDFEGKETTFLRVLN